MTERAAAQTRASRLRPATHPPPDAPEAASEAPGPCAGTFFVVPGDPVPQPRPRVFKNGGVGEDPRATRQKQATIMAARRQKAPRVPGEVELSVVYHRATARRCDVDNLLKLTLDALNGTCWLDDTQVVSVHARKTVDRENPRTEVYVRPFPPIVGPTPEFNAAWLRKWEDG